MNADHGFWMEKQEKNLTGLCNTFCFVRKGVFPSDRKGVLGRKGYSAVIERMVALSKLHCCRASP